MLSEMNTCFIVFYHGTANYSFNRIRVRYNGHVTFHMYPASLKSFFLYVLDTLYFSELSRVIMEASGVLSTDLQIIVVFSL